LRLTLPATHILLEDVVCFFPSLDRTSSGKQHPIFLAETKVEETSQKLQDELEGRFSRAITMLENSRSEMRTQLNKVNSSLMGLHASAPQITELPLLQQ
jgi:hypothetical protein